MGHLFSFIETTPPSLPIEPLEPSLPPTKSINASPKSALVVENDESLVNCFRELLKKGGYAVRLASDAEEGLRLFRECGPFNVVLINYYIPPREGVGIDCLAPQQTHGVELAMAIQHKNPSQGIIIVALDYQRAADVPRPPQLMHIPVLTQTGNGQLRSLLETIEVHRAINALTRSELLKLQRIAKFRIRGIGRAARGRDWEDLLDEAIYRTLIGAKDTQNGRHWNRSVSFAQHLKGAVWGIADYWKKQFKDERIYLVSELLIHDAEGDDYSPIDTVPSRQVPADQHLIDKDEKERVLVLFGDDREALQVLQGLMDGLRKTEIMSRHGLDERKYAAALKRIRLKLLDRRNDRGRG